MKKLISNSSENIGQSPGTLFYRGEKSHTPVQLQYWENTLENRDKVVFIELENLPILKPENQWFNIQGIHDLPLLQKIGNDFGIHALFLEDILNPHQRPKIETIEDCTFISLKSISLDENQEIKTHTVSFVVTENALFSFSELDGVEWFNPIINRLKKPNNNFYKKNIYYFLYALVDLLIDEYLFVLEQIGDQIQLVDQSIFTNTTSMQLDELYQLKKNLLYLEKQIHPVTDIIRKVENEITEAQWEGVQIYFDNLLDHSIQSQDIIHAYFGSVENLFTLYFSLVNLRMNRTIQALTVITVVFLPLSLLAGIYGMNFPSMPGLYLSYSFWIMMISMVLLSIFILWVLKRKNWF